VTDPAISDLISQLRDVEQRRIFCENTIAGLDRKVQISNDDLAQLEKSGIGQPPCSTEEDEKLLEWGSTPPPAVENEDGTSGLWLETYRAQVTSLNAVQAQELAWEYVNELCERECQNLRLQASLQRTQAENLQLKQSLASADAEKQEVQRNLQQEISRQVDHSSETIDFENAHSHLKYLQD
jgi:septal ring factor EnvC (AmiA/AmiB activator)